MSDRDEYEKGLAAWRGPEPIEHFEELGLTTDAFMDGWFDAKHSDPEWVEDNELIDG
jgi:hypothetical protein